MAWKKNQDYQFSLNHAGLGKDYAYGRSATATAGRELLTPKVLPTVSARPHLKRGGQCSEVTITDTAQAETAASASAEVGYCW